MARQLTPSEVPINSVVIHVFTWCVLFYWHKGPLDNYDHKLYGAFSHEIPAAILLFQNSEMAAIFVFDTSSAGGELFSCVNASFVHPITLYRCLNAP